MKEKLSVLHAIIDEYLNNKISLRDLKIVIEKLIESGDDTFIKKTKIDCLHILIDAYSQSYSYKGNSKIKYMLFKIIHAAGIGEDPITENEIRIRLKKYIVDFPDCATEHK
jgi:hypothetical protein